MAPPARPAAPAASLPALGGHGRCGSRPGGEHRPREAILGVASPHTHTPPLRWPQPSWERHFRPPLARLEAAMLGVAGRGGAAFWGPDPNLRGLEQVNLQIKGLGELTHQGNKVERGARPQQRGLMGFKPQVKGPRGAWMGVRAQRVPGGPKTPLEVAKGRSQPWGPQWIAVARSSKETAHKLKRFGFS